MGVTLGLKLIFLTYTYLSNIAVTL